MAYKVKVSPNAKLDIREAVAYYKKKASVKVAQNFVTDYQATLKKILQNPFFQEYYKDFRGLPLKKYPYIIFYKIAEDKKLILVDAVFQANQDTSKRPE
ncbi:type II toxin-antitoxin system RelE/ParE family toxin [Epilithonimonas hispanica]|uniref:Type II toxin-antitoxin system RelE/ParE family toxin n=1 Tax=Epilithonimonas hispanica TaxID=358687 RepID=A0A3D9CLN9_9FLAO|nr:type II toxin-antitoxin system RelE/ParE family toxin [Epilithonimonas hispanica]REC66652.1 type II toxin-antitoxin system RelE/ParE family toxin [Epilithonimonas hispanica]REC66660.1 type II toxin-antitoxin system RelE/ParE family toxin [Epilithonimonas hispanica]